MSTESPRVVAVVGSRRSGSYTRMALEYALEAAEDAGAETELVDPRSYDLPLVHPDTRHQGDSESVVRTIRAADSVLLGTPASHGTLSATLKNVLEYCRPEEFEETTVGLLVVAGGGMCGTTLEHLRLCVRVLHGWALPPEVAIPRVKQQFDDDGSFTDPDVERKVADLGRSLVEYAHIEPTPTNEYAADE